MKVLVAVLSASLALGLLAVVLHPSALSPSAPQPFSPQVSLESKVQQRQQLLAQPGPEVEYYYIPADELHPIQMLANATSNDTGITRSCAIQSLVEQANEVLTEWDKCGYSWVSSTFEGAASGGVVSGPSNDRLCGPDNIWLWPCKEKYARTFKGGRASALRKCYLGIKGMSQTCDTYDVCGSRYHEDLGQTSVCTSPEGAYYKEPSVQRMCGVCSMFRAEVKVDRTPDFNGKGGTDGKKDGCLASDGVVKGLRGSDSELSEIRVGDLRAGDLVLTAEGLRKVYYTLTHKDPRLTVEISWAEGPGAEGLRSSAELSALHMLPVYTKACGGEFCSLSPLAPAERVKPGDYIYVAGQDGISRAKEVVGVRTSESEVRYLLVEGDFLYVSSPGSRSSALVSVYSTALGALETLPFRFLQLLSPSALQWGPVAKALEWVLESPLLSRLELALSC